MWLLNRKKLTRALLFQYVNARQVPISGQADKLMISDMIIKLWNGTANVSSVAGSNNAATIECREVTEPARESDAMGMKFAQWFYGIILNVSNGTPGPSVADQFWRDARLSITVNHSGNSDRKETFGSNEVFAITLRLFKYWYSAWIYWLFSGWKLIEGTPYSA